MDELRRILEGSDNTPQLDVAAAQIALIEYPDLDVQQVVRELDEIAAALPSGCSGPEFVEAANQHLFNELAFTGNDFDYYDPRNSCLNEVLRRRLGIPITLSVVYMEVARRLGQPVYGIGQPGHFLVQYDDGEYSTFIDPFEKGLLRTVEDPVHRRATKRQILTRMLQNLKHVYAKDRQWTKASAVSNLLVAAYPNAPDEIRTRGFIHMQNKRYQAARADFARYLELAPNAPDHAQVTEQIRNLDKWSAQWN